MTEKPSTTPRVAEVDHIRGKLRLEDVSPSPAFFDIKKLRAFNGEYIRALSLDDFIAACQPWLRTQATPWPPSAYDEDTFAAVAELAQTRIAVLSEIVPMVDFLFLKDPVVDEASWAKAMTDEAAPVLRAVLDAYGSVPWQADRLRASLETVGAERGLTLGKVQAPVRVAVTGRTAGLPLFESLEALDRDRTLARLESALVRLG
jgi:glutamyl-tRNA synthetase